MAAAPALPGAALPSKLLRVSSDAMSWTLPQRERPRNRRVPWDGLPMTAVGCPGLIVPCFRPHGRNNDQSDGSRRETQTARNPPFLLPPSGVQPTRILEKGRVLADGADEFAAPCARAKDSSSPANAEDARACVASTQALPVFCRRQSWLRQGLMRIPAGDARLEMHFCSTFHRRESLADPFGQGHHAGVPAFGVDPKG